MKRDTVAKPVGLFQRGGVWWLRVVVPLDLREAHNGASKVVRSLKTTDRREADRLAAERRLQVLQGFEDMRRALHPRPVATLTPELAATLAQGIRARLLAWDDQLRDNPATAEHWLQFAESFSASRLTSLRLGSGPVSLPAPAVDRLEALARLSPLNGLTTDQVRRLARVNADADQAAALASASRSLSHVIPLADLEARRLGLLIDWRSPEARPVLLACLEAFRAGVADMVKRDKGEPVVTPEAPAEVLTSASMTLREVFAKWKEGKKRGPDALAACERALAAFESQSGQVPVTQIKRNPHGTDFRAWLLRQGITPKTAHDRLTWVKSLLRFACRDLDLIPKQPWEGLHIEHETRRKRRPWTTAELQAFFAQPVWSAYELPKVADAAGPAAYWIPLLGLFTGARVGELCQLRVQDVVDTPEGPVLSINEEAEGATVKTAASIRDVPLHSELVRLGFLDYVAELRKAGGVSLWPAMRFRKGKPGAFFSEWFGTARRKVPGEAPDFHSLRHTVRSALAEAELPEAIKDRITGHEVRGSTGTRVYEAVSRAALRRAVEAIKYPGLALPKVYQRTSVP